MKSKRNFLTAFLVIATVETLTIFGDVVNLLCASKLVVQIRSD
jgi:F0F1-type ATP synthase membrane subunit c/vacuolar-type H+-ATPase subunit K